MSWSIAISVALLNALLTGALAIGAGFFLMHALNIHDRDGGVSMGVFFMLGPFAMGIGLVCGFIATWWTGATEWSQFWKAFGGAAALPNAITVLVVAIQLFNRPVSPKIDGRELELHAEVFIPEGLVPEELVRHPETKASLYAGDDDNRYITVDTAGITVVAGGTLVPVYGDLNTVAPRRMLSFIPYSSASLTLDLPLRSRPVMADTEWTQPMALRRGILSDGTYDLTEATIRFRVVLKQHMVDSGSN